MPGSVRCALVLASLALSACAATTGRAWVHEPEDANLDTDAAYAVRDLDPAPGSLTPIPQASAAESVDAPRPRLAHVVSLGQSESGAARPALAAATPAPPGVVVNIVNYGSAPYSAGYGYPLSYRTSSAGASAAPPAAASGGAPALGQDWSRPPSYGPAFPWKTGPASPWQRAR